MIGGSVKAKNSLMQLHCKSVRWVSCARTHTNVDVMKARED